MCFGGGGVTLFSKCFRGLLFCGGSSLIAPPCHDITSVASSAAAAGSVGLNYYGSLLTESKRVELQKEVGGGRGEGGRGEG